MNKSNLIVLPVFLLIGVALGYWAARSNPPIVKPAILKEQNNEPKVLYYRHPMDPTISSEVPAKDAMGMDYIAVYEDSNNDTPGTVSIDPVQVQNIGVRTTKAICTTLVHSIRAVGRVAYDEQKLVRLHPKTEGWIEHVTVNTTGQHVMKNTDLLSIYSPQLVASQQEYLLALNNWKALENNPYPDIRRGAEQLMKSAFERLTLLDVPKHQLHELETTQIIKKSLHIHSPSSGIVIKIGAREGQFVSPETEIYTIADLSNIWVYADIYENELPWVNVGDPVEMTLSGIPGKTFEGHLAYIYPYAESKTRTIKVRMVFDNSELLLKPNMFAEVVIYSSNQEESIVIPSEAVIRSGARNRVFVVRSLGKFEPRIVKLGMASNGKVSVLEGLEIGEEIVVSAQFLIDSESKLSEAAAKMTR